MTPFLAVKVLPGVEQEGDNQSVNSDSFGESQTNKHVDTDQRLRFRVTPDGVECLTRGDTDTDSWANGSQTNC